jgi:hypothetical protein
VTRLTILWICDAEARLIHFTEESMARDRIGGGTLFFQLVSEELGSARGILLLGPFENIVQFRDYLIAEHPSIVARVIASEVVDDPLDEDIAALALKHFTRRAG